MANVVMRHGAAAAGLERQARLGAVERLDLALFVDRQHHRLGWRRDVQADDVDQLLGKLRVARALEAAHPVRLQPVRLPNALHGAQRDARGPGHRPAGPVRRLARRRAAGQRDNAGHRRGRDRWLAGLAGLVAQQAVNASLGEALLPAPDAGAGDAARRCDPLHRAARGGRQDNPGAPDVLARSIAVGDDRFGTPPLDPVHDHANCLGHAGRLARPRPHVNHQNASEH